MILFAVIFNILLGDQFLFDEKYKEKCKILDSLYTECITYSDSIPLKIAYFKTFPNNYIEFKHIFDYVEGGDTNNLGEKYFKLILLFDSIAYVIPEETYLRKLVNLSINNDHGYDAFAMLREMCFANYTKNEDIFLEILTKYRENEIRMFFSFYFKNYEDFFWHEPIKEVYIFTLNNYPSIFKILESEYRKAKESSKHH